LTYFHVFTYSDRPGTPASQMQPKIPPETARERGSLLRRLGHQKKEKFRARLKGTTQRALILNERDQDGRLLGITGNYMEVLLPQDSGDETLINRFVQVELKEARPDGRWEVELR
jgi:threonylcarbamoyladenosine tRNA methylthiotransferase MtaB